MSRLYAFRDYDKYLCLKPPLEFWLAVVYLLRPYVLKLSTFQMGRGAKTDAVNRLFDLAYPDGFSFLLAVLASLPVVMLMIVYTRRKPGASATIRAAWRNGIVFLVIALLLDAVVVSMSLLPFSIRHIQPFMLMQAMFTSIILVYVVMSRRLRDTFADFPADDADDGSTGARKPSPGQN